MGIDLEFASAIEAGERNLEAKQLIENWCAHARVEKHGGTGMIEMQTGLPIGHHSMICDHAPAGGIASWLLESSATQFYDAHCVKCSKRKPVRLPNLSKIIARRDEDRRLLEIRRNQDQQREEAALEERRFVRARLCSVSSVAVRTFLDDLDCYDKQRDEESSRRILESAKLAPEILTPDLVEYLFSLLEGEEEWSHHLCLEILVGADCDQARLCCGAIKCLEGGRALDFAAEVVERLLVYVRADDVAGAVGGLAYVAAPPRSPFESHDALPGKPMSLWRVYEKYPDEVVSGLVILLSRRDPFFVALSARAAISLVSRMSPVSLTLTRSLAVSLSRVESLVELNRSSEQREVVGELTRALVAVFLSAPLMADKELMSYFDSASQDGEARIIGVYERVVRHFGGAGCDIEGAVKLEACRVALSRLLSLAEVSDNQEVIKSILDAFRTNPGQLASVTGELMDLMLGVAALLDTKLMRSAESSIIASEPNMLEKMTIENRRNQMFNLRAAILIWAVHGAASSPVRLASFTDLLGKMTSISESLHAEIVRQLSSLLKTGEGMKAMLPFIYSGMVGRSNLIRAATAKLIGDLGSRRFEELPELVVEAFFLLVEDRYVVVHKAAIRASAKIRMSDDRRDKFLQMLVGWIFTYKNSEDQGFLLECISAFEYKSSQSKFNGKFGSLFLDLLKEVDPKLLLTNEHRFLLRGFSGLDGYSDFVVSLFGACEYDFELEQVLELVREIPSRVGRHAAEFKKILKLDPLDGDTVGVFLEVLTRDGEWDAACEVAQIHLTAVPATTRMRTRQLHALQQKLAAEFEQLISNGEVDRALVIGMKWDEAQKELITLREHHEKADPFKSFFRAP